MMSARQKRILYRPRAQTSHAIPRGEAFYMNPLDALINGVKLLASGVRAFVFGGFIIVEITDER